MFHLNNENRALKCLIFPKMNRYTLFFLIFAVDFKNDNCYTSIMKRFGILCILVAALSLALATKVNAQVNTNAPSGLLDRPTTSQPAKPNKEKDNGSTADNKDKGGNKDKDRDRDNSGDRKHGKEGKENNKQGDSNADNGKKKANEGHTVAGHKGGYRIQAMIVTGSKGKGQATARAREIASKFPHYRTYITYKAPSWRLRLGDFDSQEDARSALAKMRRSFPSFSGEMSVVRDRINVWR